MQFHVRDEGPRDDPAPIVLLHGTSSSLHTWEGWVAGLRQQHRVITFDLPGFGLTGPAPDADYSIEAHVRHVLAVLDHLGVPHEEGFFSKDTDVAALLKDGWQDSAWTAFREKFAQAPLLFYINHLGWEVASQTEVFAPHA